jgi:hypothetical protein
VYDVLYLDRTNHEKVLAAGLAKTAACDVARAEARRRGVGRMFLAGSEMGPVADCVVIVHTRRPAA